MRRALLSALVALSATLLASSALAQPRPRLATGPGGSVHLSGLPSILDDEAVDPQLTSGLTTSFAFRCKGRGGLEGGALVEVRYEKWDEEFHVRTTGTDGRPRGRVVPDRAALSDWWRTLELPVLGLEPQQLTTGAPIRVTLDVLPFSRAEQLDAIRWLPQSGPEGAARSPEDGDTTFQNLLEVLFATSVRRRAIATYRWNAEAP